VKILTLCYEYPPLGGGAGRAAKSIAEALAARGHDMRFQTGGMPHLAKHERINDLEVYRTSSFRRREEACSVPEMGLWILMNFAPTLRHLRTWRPDVMHVHLAVPTGALACAANVCTGVPYVLTVHLGDVPGAVPEQTAMLYRVFGPFIRPIWKRAAAISAVSEFVRELAVAAYRQPVQRIPNAIDLPPHTAAPPHVGQPPQLVASGRFNPQKNFVLLIEALAQLADLDWQLTIIGDGDEMLAVRAAITRHGLEHRVNLPGWCEIERVASILADADIFLMPSSVEGLSVAALEALKHGLAIVGSDIGGLRDVIDHGVNGLRVKPNDSAVLANEVRILLAEPATILRMKHASREKAREFDREKIAAQYEQLLLDAAQRRPR
jgi:glycosyltransferase involved in cell wall biosynthesis